MIKPIHRSATTLITFVFSAKKLLLSDCVTLDAPIQIYVPTFPDKGHPVDGKLAGEIKCPLGLRPVEMKMRLNRRSS